MIAKNKSSNIQLSSLKKNAFYNTLRTLMQIIFPLITFPYASRVLMPEGIGIVNFSSTIINYFAIFAGLGVSVYGTREVAKCRDNKNLLSKKVKEIFINHNHRHSRWFDVRPIRTCYWQQ